MSSKISVSRQQTFQDKPLLSTIWPQMVVAACKMLLEKSLMTISDWCQSCESGTARASARRLLEPCRETDQVDGHSGEDMLQVGLGRTNIARTAQAAASGSLGNRALDTRSLSIRFPEFGCALALPGLLEGKVLLLGAKGKRSRTCSCSSTSRACGAMQAVLWPKAHMHDRLSLRVLTGIPVGTDMSLGADDSLCIPSDFKAGEASGSFGSI